METYVRTDVLTYGQNLESLMKASPSWVWQKSHIRETLNLSTYSDSTTNTKKIIKNWKYVFVCFHNCMCHLSPVTCLLSPVTCHLSPVTNTHGLPLQLCRGNSRMAAVSGAISFYAATTYAWKMQLGQVIFGT